MGMSFTNGNVSIGAYRFHDRKRPALCVAEGNGIVVCGYFTSQDNADFFTEKMAELLGLKEEKEDG